jgi:hypothetical protein
MAWASIFSGREPQAQVAAWWLKSNTPPSLLFGISIPISNYFFSFHFFLPVCHMGCHGGYASRATVTSFTTTT